MQGYKTGLTTNATLVTTPVIELPGNQGDLDPVEAEAGAIAGAVFGILVCVAFISFAGIMYLRRKRERDEEHHRKTKVLRESTKSAGVYMDTTQDFKPRKSDSSHQGPEYKSLHKDPNMYESDSEDEL